MLEVAVEKRLLVRVLLTGALLLAPALSASAAEREPSEEVLLQPFVHGGEPIANPGWVASIIDNGFFTCSGSLIHSQWVLTAAHCVDQGVSGFTIRVGGDRWYQGHERQISQVHIHPGYDTGDITSVDLAVLRLSSPLSGITVPSLSSNSSWPIFDQELMVAGWGLTSDSSGVPANLQAAWVFVNSDPSVGAAGSFCPDEAVAPSGYDDFCFSDEDSWACSGDSGGPLVGYATPAHSSGTANTLYGVTSFGSLGCSSAIFDSVAQGVGRHSTWIRSFLPSPTGGDEMFFYRSTDGAYRYYDMKPNGALGTALQTGTGYSLGWDSITAIDLDG